MFIHPKARDVISKLDIPSPIKKYFSNNEWELDLSNNTNPLLEEYSSYPDVKQEDLKNLYLKRILSLNSNDHFNSEEFSKITPENVLFTVGSMEGIDILLRTFCEPNKDKICIIHPTFSAYEHWGLIHNIDVKRVSLSGEYFNSFSIKDIMKIKPKMVFICNPNNPTGTILKSGMLEKLCETFDGFVVVDEAYIEFSEKNSALFYLQKYKNLIILRTFSKAWGLAGARCGIILADKLIIHTLRYVQLPFSLSSPTQSIIRQGLSYPERTFSTWETIKKFRKSFIEELSALTIVERVFKSETNFVLAVFRDSQSVMGKLKENKIHVLDCSTSIPHSIRISLGTEGENKKFIDVICKAYRPNSDGSFP